MPTPTKRPVFNINLSSTRKAEVQADSSVQIDGINVSLDSQLLISFSDLLSKYNLPPISSIYSQQDIVQNWKTVSFESLDLKYTTVGTKKDHGGINSSKPNIYFNIKQNKFQNKDMLFRFSTNSLNSGSSATNTWSCDPSIRSDFSLTAGTNVLTPVSSYGKYFYQLASNQQITNDSIKFTPSLVPTYTVLVFALGRESIASPANYATDFNNLMSVNQIHRFVPTTYVNTNSVVNFVNFKVENSPYQVTQDAALSKFNMPPLNAQVKGQYADQSLYIASFTGSPLNNKDFFKTEILNYTDKKVFQNAISNQNPQEDIKINSQEFYVLSNPNVPQFGAYLNNLAFNNYYDASKSTKYNYLPYNNIANLPTNLASPETAQPVVVTPNGGSSVNLNNFSMFFVEMFSFPILKGAANQEDLLCFQTFVNGMPMSSTINKLDTTKDFKTEINYVVRLLNKYTDSTAGPNTKMYLFDYSCGKTKDINLMYKRSRNLIESLAYEYRNILLKSTTDLQICNSSDSLKLSPLFAHPFLNMFFK